MANYVILLPSDVRLNCVSSAVRDVQSEHVAKVVQAMTKIAMGARDEKHPEAPSMVGLAAPQIGVFERIIAVDLNANPGSTNFDVDLRFIINPQIKDASVEEELGREGCYSTGDIAGAVYRAKSVTVVGLDLSGDLVEHRLEGFVARIVQHEIDHLNGIRFPDRIRDPKHLHAFESKLGEFQRYRTEWATWQNLYPVESWIKVKSGDS